MSLLASLSLKRKLIAILMLASSVAMLLACSAFALHEIRDHRESARRRMLTTARVTAEGAVSALQFGNCQAVEETLKTLRAAPRILDAAFIDRTGGVLARHCRPDHASSPPPLRPDGAHFSSGYLEIYQPVIAGQQRIGTIYLKSDLRRMHEVLWRHAWFLAAALAAAFFSSLLVSSLLQRVISRPVLHLAETASRVCKDHNYSLRALKTTQDEIGELVDRFNEMMAQIQSRDAELRAAHLSLEEKVAQRTRALENEIAERRRTEQELLRAKHAAEESSRAKSLFLANMSHELRTPLNAIIGYSEMLQEEAVECGHGACVKDLEKVRHAGKHLLALINDVLDLSKIEAGRAETRLEPALVSSVLEDVVGTAEPLAKANGNTLVVRRQTRRDVLHTDPVKLRQSLLNLLSNACKFTENGTITLEVATEVVDGVEWMNWRVSDTGIGIAPEQRGRLFQSFSQLDSSATRKHGGTGLGLALSQKFCQLMGGQITVESKPGRGSVFTIRVPVDGQAEQTGQEPGEDARKCREFCWSKITS